MTIFPFTPNANTPYEFQPTLDGSQYNAVVRWNIFGRRFYLFLYQLNGTRVLVTPVTGSPVGSDISLVAGYYTSTLVFRAPSQQFEVSP